MTPPAPDPGAGRSAAALYTLMSVMFINIMGFGIVVPLLPFYAQSFHAQPWQIALIFSAYSLGSFFGEPFWGRLSDRVGRKPILVFTTLANCACDGALAFAPNIEWAFAIRLLGGMAAGSGSVVQGYIADVTPIEERATRMARLGAAYNIGFILGPFVGGVLAKGSMGPAGFHIPLLVASACGACSALGIALVVRESRARQPAVVEPGGRWAMVGYAAEAMPENTLRVLPSPASSRPLGCGRSIASPGRRVTSAFASALPARRRRSPISSSRDRCRAVTARRRCWPGGWRGRF